MIVSPLLMELGKSYLSHMTKEAANVRYNQAMELLLLTWLVMVVTLIISQIQTY